MLSRDTYPVGLKGPSSLCEFVTSSSCGHCMVPVFSEQVERGAPPA